MATDAAANSSFVFIGMVERLGPIYDGFRRQE
jgi:hypothetical protein